MRIKILIFVVTLSLLSNLNSVSLNAAETTFDFKRYELVLSNVTWDQARTAAQAAGGDLLVIETEAENTHIFNWLQTQLTSIRSATSGISNAGGAYYVWLGASDADEEGAWIWVNGVKFYDGTGASGSAESNRYNNWGSGPLGSEPDDSGFLGQDYAAMGMEAWPTSRAAGQGIGEAGEWNDVASNSTTVYVIEYPRDTSSDIIMAPVFPSSSSTQSYLRFINPTGAAGQVLVKFTDGDGAVLREACKVNVGVNLAPQLSMETLESSCQLAASPENSPIIGLSYTADFDGYIQHVIWNPSGGSLTNYSVCNKLADSANYLANVHSSLITAYPSRIIITNSSSAAQNIKIDITDSGNGNVVGTWTSPSIPGKGHGVYTITDIEDQLGYTPPEGRFHHTIKINSETSDVGMLGHYVDNINAGVLTEFTARCASR